MRNIHKYKPESSALKIKLPVLNPQEDYECWYFESLLENGDQIRISIRINETYSLPIVYGVQVEHIENGNIRVISDSFSGDEVEFSTEKCNHKLGNNWFIDLGEYFEIHTEINCTTVDLKFYPEVYGFNHRRDGKINLNLPGTKYFGWNIPVPKARVEGAIIRDGNKVNVEGFGYHDHMWSNTRLEKNMGQVLWGKIFDKEISIYYVIVIEDEESISSKLIVANGESIALKMEGNSFDDKLKTKVSDYTTDEESGILIPNKILLQHKSDLGSININIELDTINRQMDSENHRLGEKAFRFVGNESYNIRVNGKEFSGNLKSLHELITF